MEEMIERKRRAALERKESCERQRQDMQRYKRKADSCGGFLFPEEDEVTAVSAPVFEDNPPPNFFEDQLQCIDCQSAFSESLLLKQFDVNVCDHCRRTNEEKYSLATKTEAKQEYLLTDADLDAANGGLRCIEKKNPQHERWGMMKLYLRYQIEKICFDRYGGEEGLDAEIVRRGKEKMKMQEKKQKNKVALLRKQTMTSTWMRVDSKHTHEYGEEEPKGAAWVKRCTVCGFEVVFEKM